MDATIDVVVVLPWLPAIAMPNFSRINSASSSPRGITGICSRRASATSGFEASSAEVTTTAFAPQRSPPMAQVNHLRQTFAAAPSMGLDFEVGTRTDSRE